MHNHGTHADRFHEDDVNQYVPQDLLVLHDTAAQFDHGRMTTKLSDPAHRFHEHVGFLDSL